MARPEELLMCKVYQEDYKGALTLIRNKVNINYENMMGCTPLFLAIERGDYKMVKFLLDHGADCNRRTKKRIMIPGNHMEIPTIGVIYEENTPLIIAATYGQVDILQLLIKRGADINFRDATGTSALFTALKKGKGRCAQILIQNGAEVTPVEINICPDTDIKKEMMQIISERNKFEKNDPSLHPAVVLHPVLDGDCEKLRDLIEKGLNINLEDDKGNTALHFALENGFLDCAELLIKNGANVNAQGTRNITALHIAASLGMSKIIPLLIENGAVVDAKAHDYLTPLHFAVSNSSLECVKLLLNYGASVNAKFLNGITALHIAVSNSHECIELLVKENADIFATDDVGSSPLELAIENTDLDTLKKILSGKYNIISTDGSTPLHIAARCCETIGLQFLINQGCDVNVTNHNGDTPLHFACTGGTLVGEAFLQFNSNLIPKDSRDAKHVELLLKAGAEINKKNNKGLFPVHLCATNNLCTHLELLHKHGAKLDSLAGSKNQTPLHYAAEAGSLSCIKYLIEKGVDKNIVNSDNCTALMLAAKNSMFESVKFLLEKDVPLWAL